MEIFLAEVDHLLSKEVTAPAGPAAAQVKGTAVCSANDRESPWVTVVTGTRRARGPESYRHGLASQAALITSRQASMPKERTA